VTLEELEKIKADIKSGALHPMEAKKRLAVELVDRFCSKNGLLRVPEFTDKLSWSLLH